MGYILWAFLFIIAGFILESCVCVYHRARENNRIMLSAVTGGIITCIGILVISRIVYSVISGPLGHLSLIYVFIFALGKGIGTYTSLTMWDRLYPNKAIKDECGQKRGL